MQKRVIWAISALAVVLIIAVVGFYFASGKKCLDESCFESLMAKCKKGSYINEESEASWGYKIKGARGQECRIEVTLLQAKEGDLKLRNYEDSSMICSYNVGEVVFPEKDLTACHGLLKENLQTVLIENLHSYIIDNLDDIRTGLQA